MKTQTQNSLWFFRDAKEHVPSVPPVSSGRDRDTAMDLLRILACVMVVLIHVSSQNWYALTPESPDWLAMNIYDSMARPAVPLFLMMSGAFMLAPEKMLSIRRLWLRYMPRLAGAYALWSMVYALYEQTGALTDFSGLTFAAVVKSAVVGQYHLWYLPVIIMLYILLPVLRAALHGDGDGERRRCEYLLLILLAYGTLKATILCFDFPGQLYVQNLADKFSFGALSAYAGYFILGYYLYRYRLPRAARIALYVLGLCSAPVIAFATYIISVWSGAPDERFYTVFFVPALCAAATLFVFFRELVSKLNFSHFAKRSIGFISSCTLGVYLVHVLFLNLLADRAGINALSLPAALSVPALTASVYVASLAFASFYTLGYRVLRGTFVKLKAAFATKRDNTP